MRLSELYSGKTVTFKIPNSQWLVEVFLPTASTNERMVRVEAKVIGWNQHSPKNEGQKSYVIVPRKSFIFKYLEGRDARCRKESDLLTNPYGPSLPKICPLNVDENNCQELIIIIKTRDRGKMKMTTKTKTKKKLRKETLCPYGQYWSVSSDACALCPKGSRSTLDGYYCEKIKSKG